MDTQRKKGVLEVCVLSVLSQGASYGYMINGEVSKCIEITESTLYPLLKRLESSGCLTTYKEEYNGRTRKYYQITDAGRQKIKDFLDEWEQMQRIYQFVQKSHIELEEEEKEEHSNDQRPVSYCVHERAQGIK